MGEEVSGFAHGADDVGGNFACALARSYGNNFMMRLVKRRTNEVIHASVKDDEVFLAIFLDVEHAGDKRSGLGDEKASGFEKEMDSFESADGLFERGGVLLNFFFGAEGQRCVIFDAQPSSGVEELDGQPIFTELLNERGDAAGGGSEGVGSANLRADVNTDSGGLDPLVLCRAAIDSAGAVNVDAKFVLAQSSGDVGMGFGEDVRIDAQRDAGALLELGCAFGEQVELALTLDVKEQDSEAQGEINFGGRLADSEKTTRAAAALFTDRMRSSSPPDTMSKPAPSRSSSLRMASAEFAFTA